MIVFVNGTIILSFKENMTWQDSNGGFKYRMEFKINKKKKSIRTMSSKIVRSQKLIWQNIMRSIKSQTSSIIYIIDYFT